MTAASGRRWWEDFDEGVRRLHETGWGADASVLSREICELLEDVDRAFAVTGADTPGWPNPYPDGAAPGEEEYERLTDPGKFLIVVARARAWTTVLRGRGWAREASKVGWALRPLDGSGAETILRPVAAGAVPLVLTTHTPVDNAHIVTVTVAAGDPAVALASIPDCGCDACDRGSAALLEEMDRWVLSVVDGSLHVEVTASQYSIRSSFGGGRGGHPVQTFVEPTTFTAAPWAPNSSPRPIPG